MSMMSLIFTYPQYSVVSKWKCAPVFALLDLVRGAGAVWRIWSAPGQTDLGIFYILMSWNNLKSIPKPYCMRSCEHPTHNNKCICITNKPCLARPPGDPSPSPCCPLPPYNHIVQSISFTNQTKHT